MKNDGFLVTGQPKGQGPVAIVIVGINRGGTSAVSAALDAIGLPLGKRYAGPNYEDAPLGDAMRRKNWGAFRSLVAEYESSHGKFAWKFPASRNHLFRINRYFANPRYIFVYRDIFAIANRKRQVQQKGILWSMAGNLWDYAKMLLFVKLADPYALHVSYEKILTNGEAFAEALLEFCECGGGEEQKALIRERISASPDAYLQWTSRSQQMLAIEKHGYRGLIEHLSPALVLGWAIRMDSEEPAVVEIRVNDVLLGTAVADRFSDRLTEVAGDRRKGHITFRFDFPSAPLAPEDRISVRFQGTEHELVGAPVTVAGYVQG